MKKYLFLLFVMLIANPSFSQKTVSPYAGEWRKIDSLLIDNKLPESAAKMVKGIYAKAVAAHQPLQVLKAQMYMLRTDDAAVDDEDGEYARMLTNAEKYTAAAEYPYKNIWYSVVAELYCRYYDDKRYDIFPRTPVADTAQVDLAFWDAGRFYKKISGLFLASLEGADRLKKLDISNFEDILTPEVNTKKLRPTLYDLLAFRAVSYFGNETKDVSNAALQFVMDDPDCFSDAKTFISKKFVSKDSSSLPFYALVLYQQILAMHVNDVQPGALIDADIKRIKFVFKHSIVPNKKELYQNAILSLANKYSGNNECAEALYLYYISLYNSDPDNDSRNPSGKLPQLKEKLEEIAVKYPGSEGGVHANEKLADIESQKLNISTEEVVLPQQPSKCLVEYRNHAKIYLRVYEVKLTNSRHQHDLADSVAYMNALQQKKVYDRAVALPGSEDMESHSIEVKIDELPEGEYVLIASADPEFGWQNNQQAYAHFQVSHISNLTIGIYDHHNHSGYVLDRKTGAPLANAKLTFYRGQAGENDEIAQTTVTKADGGYTANWGGLYVNGLQIEHNSSKLYLEERWYNIESEAKQQIEEKSFFFTDRSIYRPGQTVFFKAIVLKRDETTRKSEVVANKATEVNFYDANSQKINSVKLTTNEFGSVQGSFVIPTSTMTGTFEIKNETGSTTVSVEEYKRPKFMIEFDTLKSSYALNEPVQITGYANSYSGSNIEGAAVKYRVMREMNTSYDWKYPEVYAESKEMEIAHGETTTDAAGHFKIDFKAIPDLAIADSLLPVYTYTVSIDVTDISGETRSAEKQVAVGKQTIQITASIPERSMAGKLDVLHIKTENLNDEFIAARMHLRISLLQSPAVVYRKRLWNKPDKHLMTEQEYRKYFPLDEYEDEGDYKHWAKQQIVFETDVVTTRTGEIALPKNTWKETGYYMVEMEAKDAKGIEVNDRGYVFVYNAASQKPVPVTAALLDEKEAYEPGETARLELVTGLGQMNWIQQIQTVGKLEVKNITAGTKLEWMHPVTEEDRGGMTAHWISVNENRVYEESAVIKVPWSNMDLNIKWRTHRDKLKPGEKEKWTLEISGNKKERLAAEMVATMYDASLDAYEKHEWGNLGIRFYNEAIARWDRSAGFGRSEGKTIDHLGNRDTEYNKRYYDLLTPNKIPLSSRTYEWAFGDAGVLDFAKPKLAYDNEDIYTNRSYAKAQYTTRFTIPGIVVNDADGVADNRDNKLSMVAYNTTAIPFLKNAAHSEPIHIRKNLSETAFFYPQLRTDAEGNIKIEFTMPEALTEWKLMGFAHTKDMKYGLMEGKVKTQKDLMVVPGLPRFLRQGDDMVITTKINNLSDKELNGKAELQILDAASLRPLNIAFRIKEAATDFKVAAGQSTVASWSVHVPESIYEPVVVRVTAGAGDFSDGEENTLPVVTNRMLITESLPLWMNGSGTKSFSLDKLKYSDSSKTLAQHKLTVEYTSNPAWYAIQALPYLMEYPYECAEQTFNRYYANALAAHILDQSPKVRAVFDKWKNEDTSALLSNLEKNQELKSALLEETPWVMEAKNETEQKHRVALLFNTSKVKNEQAATLKKLEDMQLGDGSFSWFKGGSYPDRYITQYIVTGIKRLDHLGIANEKTNDMAGKATQYLDKEIINEYEALKKQKDVKLDDQHIGYTEIELLYLKSFVHRRDENATEAYGYYTEQAVKYWPKFNPYMKGMIAIALDRAGDEATAATIIQSLKETAIQSEEQGMHWKQENSWWWYEAPIETQSLLIECFAEVAKDTVSVNAMKRWLLIQKQTQNWHTTKATADACYALMLNG